jgi:hypothetical protein
VEQRTRPQLRSLALGALLLSFALTSQAQLASRWCAGTIANPYVDWDGGVMVLPSFRGDYVRICHLRYTTTGSNGITVEPVTCAGWLALVRQAVAGNKSMTLRYENAPTCDTLPNYYSAPVPEYLMLN